MNLIRTVLGALTLCLLLSTSAFAVKIAIIDSGTDMLHDDIMPKAWINPGEIADNDRDEDRNGYQDDVHGWNFAESNPDVIDYSYLGLLTEDIRKFFGIQARFLAGTHTQDEIDWARQMLQDEDFIKRVTVYGNFMHGTHVAGIAIEGVESAEMMAVKLIPTEVNLPFFVLPHEKGAGVWLMKQAMAFLATQQVNQFKEIVAYVDSHGMDIANGSFGTGYAQAKMIVEGISQTIFKSITEEEIDEVAKHFINTLVEQGLAPFTKAKNTLFVFAAGNDGLDNDEFPIFPTNLKADNIISVAASFDNNDLAIFSNYGKDMVDVAAPGVNIVSAVPGNQYIGVSGTSQAAPYVAKVAAQIKEENAALTPGEVKQIIMGTVDKKDWLKGKVVSEGTTNIQRAVFASSLSKNVSVAEAIRESKTQIKDLPVNKSFSIFANRKGFVLPLPNQFVFKGF